MLLALPAIWLVSTSGSDDDKTPSEGREPLAEGVIEGLLAGVGFAVLLIGLGLAGDDAGLWPVVAGETSSLILLAVVLLETLRRLEHRRLPARDLAGAGVVGLLGGFASIFYLLSTQTGLLSIVAVLTSLYPASTVVLSAVLLHEPIGRRQTVGLLLAVAAVVLIVVG